MPVGRPPKPTKLKILQGTFQKCRAKEEPKIESLLKVPRPPKSFKGDAHKRARAEWNRIAAELVDAGLLSNLDLVALECYCFAYERMLVAEEILVLEGLTFTSPKGFIMQRPEVSIASVARREVREFLTQFGMSPASRSRVAAKKTKEVERDEMEELLRAGR
jgi:P27 family predicted phage terminase small subunit